MNTRASRLPLVFALALLLAGLAHAALAIRPVSSPSLSEPSKHSDWEEEGAPQLPPVKPKADPEAEPDLTSLLESGDVHLSEHLRSLDPALAPGRIFHIGLVSGQKEQNIWYRIPPWLAGTWRTEVEAVEEDSGFRLARIAPLPLTVRKHEMRVFGMQKDSTGAIWHYVKVPRLARIDLDGRTEYRQETTNVISRVEVGHVASFLRFNAVRVENSTGVILDTRQEEALLLMAPVAGKRMRVVAALKAFDISGKPSVRTRDDLSLIKVKAFKPLDFYRGEDMKSLFGEFLRARGLGHLAPARGK